MGVSLPGLGITLLAVTLSVYYLHSSLRSTREDGPAGTGQRPMPDRAHRQDVSELEPPLPDVEESIPSPSDDLSKQGPDKRRTALVTADPEKARHDNLQASGQAPMNANGLFNGAHDLIFYQPVMNSINEAKEQVLQWLAKFTMSGAEFDAGGHVPGCHPGTRITILERLKAQIGDAQARRMVWLHGPAGVGKSAILQSLAEQLSETSALGATLFFSRPNGRHNPDFVIPTITYQLAVRIPAYREYVKQIMVNDPKLLEKDMERQFQTLITDPFVKMSLAAEGSRWVILLDGLDECQGENAQRLIVNLISHFTCQYPMNPLSWVIASRPEAHLQTVFNSEGVRGSFEEHVVIANSDDACRDVEKFLRAKFGEVRQNYKDLIPTDVPWPAEQDLTRVSTTSSGLFALATTIVQYVDDPDACDPISQLATVLSVTEGLEPGSLSALYTIYSTILDGVPKPLLPILKLALPFYATQQGLPIVINLDHTTSDSYPLVLFATIFRLQQHTIYGALRKLHSVVKVPSLSESGRFGIHFYHASFSDYLKTLGDYTISVGMVRKYWWGTFAILCWGDSMAYESAVSEERFPAPLSWDVKLLQGALWSDGIPNLLHLLLPQCPVPVDKKPVPADACPFGHHHLFPDAKALQNVLEKINFSALILRSFGPMRILPHIYYLYRWLASAEVQAELSQSDVVKKMLVKDLDLACVSKGKPSYGVLWLYSRDHYRKETFHQPAVYIPQVSLQENDRSDWTYPELISELDRLQGENPMMDVLVVGKRPSRSCVFIHTEPIDEGYGVFYYISYCG